MNYALLANWTVYFPIAVSLFIAIRLTVGSVDSSRPTLYRVLFTSLVQLLLILSLVGICCRFGPLAFVWLVVVGAMLVILAIKQRELKRSAFLLTLFNCADQPSTVMTLAESFRTENSGWLRRRCQRLTNILRRTGDWGKATEAAGLVRGTRQKLALRLFSRMGKRGLIRRELLLGDNSEGLVDSLLLRLLVALLSGWALITVSLLLVVVFPPLFKIMREFSLDTPHVFQAMQEHSQTLFWLGSLVPAILSLMVNCVIIAYLYPSLLVARPFVWLFGSYYRALTFLGLSEIADDDLPINDALRKLAAIHPVPWESSTLDKVARRIELGMTAKEAFRKSRFLNRREASLLEMALQQHNASWTFRQLGEIGMERCLRRYSIIVQIAMVLITLVLAAIVGLIAFGMFEFLAKMIQSIK